MAMDKSAYQLTLDARVENRKLTMAPHIRAPAGSALRYEMVAAKSGASGNTSTRQGGQVRVDDSQTAALSKVSLSLDPDSRCTVSIKVFEGATLVAEGAFTYPDAAPR